MKTKIILVAFLVSLFISCQTDEIAQEPSAVEQNKELKFAVDPDGKILQNIPPEIISLMVKEFELSNKKSEIEILRNSYDFETGNLTKEAAGSDAYFKKLNELATEKKLTGKAAEATSGYRAHVAGKGWLPWTPYGQVIGTIGESRQLEAVEFGGYIPSPICKIGIAHVEGLGWYDQGCSRTLGTVGLGRRMEAIQVYAASYYRAYVAELGWLPWVSSGQVAGTVGQSRRMEAFQVTNFGY
ncbi:hypothetical protein ACHRV5_12915 [Flavobacterium sp. FlaQc-52]|jgi:uncharacterized protein YjdB|uniref:hypothetical protein n=1 Tax=unclassified Flavobacterium TaxID=196869 RepID=UPI0037583780